MAATSSRWLWLWRSALVRGSRRLIDSFPASRAWRARRELRRRGLAFEQPVFVAQVAQGKTVEVRLFLRAGIPPDATDSHGDTALIAAAASGRADLVRLLLGYGVPKDLLNPAGSTAVAAAERHGHLHVVEILLAAGAAAEGLWEARLLRAATDDDLELARRALDEGAAIDCRDDANRTPLVVAAEGGKRRIVEALLAAGADVDAADREGRTALVLAARGGHEDVVEALLEHDPAPSLDLHDQGRTALRYAVERGDRDVERLLRRNRVPGQGVADEIGLLRAAGRGDLHRVNALIDAGADVNVQDRDGNTPLILAAARGRRAVVEKLLEESAGINAQNHARDTPLIAAARAGHAEVVKSLIRRAECHPESTNTAGDTALVAAAREARIAVVTLLLGPGAHGSGRALDPDARGALGTTALIEACAANSVQVAERLLAAGASPEAKAVYGFSPWMVAALAGHDGLLELLDRAKARRGRAEAELFTAVRAGDRETVRLLARPPVDRDARTLSGRTALMGAAELGDAGVVEDLLGAGAELDLEDRNGATAVRLAAAAGHVAVLELLLRRHQDPAAEATAALPWAARRGHEAAVRTLDGEGADLNARTRAGDTPLVLAVVENRPQVVATLLELGADPDEPGRYGVTPLAAAILADRADVASMLVEAGARPSHEGNLIAAARRGDAERVGTLLEIGTAVGARDRMGRTALMEAAGQGHVDIVTRLLEALRSDEARAEAVNQRDRSGTTVLTLAASGRGAQRRVPRARVAIVRALVQAGAQVDAPGRLQRTALLEAAATGQRQVAEVLIEHGAHLDARDAEGRTPLSEAHLGGHEDVAELLEARGATAGLTEALLVKAAAAGEEGRLLRLLDQGADLEGALGRTALPAAAEAGAGSCIEALLSAGADVEAVRSGGASSLVLAAGRGDLDVVETLLSFRADPSAATDKGKTALMEAAAAGHTEVVAALLDAGAHPDAADSEGATALILAARNGHAGAVEAMLEKEGVDLDLKDAEGRTALMWALLRDHRDLAALLETAGARRGGREFRLLTAAREGDVDALSTLLADGTDPGARDENRNTPLLLAAGRGHGEVVEILLRGGADREARNARGRTALFIAAASGSQQVVEALLDDGADVEARDHRRDSPLLAAARRGFQEIVRTLLEGRADSEARNARGETALIAACARSRSAVVKELLDHGASTVPRTNRGRTALMAAVEGGDPEVVRQLLAVAQDVNAADHQGRGAWDLAFARRRPGIQELLETAGARPAADVGAVVYLAPQGDRYHREDCGTVAHARRTGNLLRRPIAAARAEGFPPCQICRPDRESPLAYRDLAFTVHHPRRAVPEAWLPLHAFASRSGAQPVLGADLEIAQLGIDYQVVSSPSPQDVAAGELLTATPELEGFDADPAAITVRFREPRHRFAFRIRAAVGASGRRAEGEVTFALGGVIIAGVPISIEVTEAGLPLPSATDVQEVHQRLRGKVFASYSHQDTPIVERVEAAARALGLEYLRDVVSLRTYHNFHERIFELIDEADVFQLFWSPAAAESDWVQREREHALELVQTGRKAFGFIRAVRWTDIPAPAEFSKLGIHVHHDSTLDPSTAQPARLQ